MLEESKKVVFEVVKDTLPKGYTFDQFLSATSEYEFVPLFVQGECIGALMHKGPQVHAAVLPKARGLWFRKWIAIWLRSKLEKYGRLITKVEDGNIAGHKLAQALTFKQVERKPGLTIYEKAIA